MRQFTRLRLKIEPITLYATISNYAITPKKWPITPLRLKNWPITHLRNHIIPPPLWTILPSVVWFVWQLIYTPRLWITLLFNTIFIFYIHISKLWTKIKIIHPSHDWNIRYVYISKVITKNLKMLVVTGNRKRAEFWYLSLQ